MPVTININNLTLCHKGSNGISIATIPDVCKTPPQPVPVPYPNIAMSSDLMKGTTTIKADGGNMCAKYGSEFFKSTGDEAGVAGGVLSSTFIKEATWITFSFDVKLEGKGAVPITDKMFHNHQNTVNAAGLVQLVIYTSDLKLNLLCNIFCDALKAGQDWKKKNPGNFNWSKKAQELSGGKYAKNFAKLGMHAEKSLLVKVSKSLAGKAAAAGRKTLGKAAVAKRLGKKAATKIGAKFIPGVNIVSTAYDIYEIGSFLAGFLPGTKAVNVIPDVSILDSSGSKATEIYDYKFPGDRYRKHQDEDLQTGDRERAENGESENLQLLQTEEVNPTHEMAWSTGPGMPSVYDESTIDKLRTKIEVFDEHNEPPTCDVRLCLDIVVYISNNIRANSQGILEFYSVAMEAIRPHARHVLIDGKGRFKKVTDKTFDLLPFWLSKKCARRDVYGLILESGETAEDMSARAFHFYRSDLAPAHLRLVLPLTENRAGRLAPIRPRRSQTSEVLEWLGGTGPQRSQ